MRHTSFSFALVPTPEQVQLAFRHAGAARFAYNQGLRLQQEAYTAHKVDPAVKVPYSGFDLINVFNKWKLTAAAGSDAAGRPGLPWRQEVSQQVFEESLVNLGRGIQRFFDARKKRKAEKGGFNPRLGRTWFLWASWGWAVALPLLEAGNHPRAGAGAAPGVAELAGCADRSTQQHRRGSP